MSIYQLRRSLSADKFCYMFLCTCVYKTSTFIQNTYTKTLLGYKSKHVHVYRIYKVLQGSNGNVSNYLAEAKK